MKKLKKIILPFCTLGILVIAVIFLGRAVNNASASAVIFTGVSGYAWSDMPDTSNEVWPSGKTGPVGRGAGWISFNGPDGGTASIEPGGTLHGYLWTPNMGWIRLDPDGPYPNSYPINPPPVQVPYNPNNNPSIYNNGGGVPPYTGVGNPPVGAPVSNTGTGAQTTSGEKSGAPADTLKDAQEGINPRIQQPTTTPQKTDDGSQTQTQNTNKGSFLPGFFQKLFAPEIAYAASIGSWIDGNTGDWHGWARACSVFVNGNGGGCSGALNPDSIRGGWDGWISLSGDISNGGHYGVHTDVNGTLQCPSLTTDGTCGWAWGGDVLGWITFNHVKVDVMSPLDLCPNINGIQDQAYLTLNGLLIIHGQCGILATGEICGDGIDNSGDGQVDEGCPNNPNNPNGANSPTVNLTATPASINCSAPGGSTVLSWTTTNATTCHAVQTWGSGFTGTTVPGGTNNVTGLVASPGTQFLFSISCDDNDSQTQAAVDTALVTCQGGQGGEICGNGIDDDGDSFVDEGCPGTSPLNPIYKER